MQQAVHDGHDFVTDLAQSFLSDVGQHMAEHHKHEKAVAEAAFKQAAADDEHGSHHVRAHRNDTEVHEQRRLAKKPTQDHPELDEAGGRAATDVSSPLPEQRDALPSATPVAHESLLDPDANKTLTELGLMDSTQSYPGVQDMSVANPAVLHQYTAARRKHDPRMFGAPHQRGIVAKILAGADYINSYGDTFAQGGLDMMTLGAFSKIEQRFDYIDRTDHNSWTYAFGRLAGFGVLSYTFVESGLAAEFANLSKATNVLLGGASSAFGTKLDDPSSSNGTIAFSFLTGAFLGHYAKELPSLLSSKPGIALLTNAIGQIGAKLTSKEAKLSVPSFIGAAASGLTEAAIEASSLYLMEVASSGATKELATIEQSTRLMSNAEQLIVDASSAVRSALAGYLPGRATKDYLERREHRLEPHNKNMR